MNKNVLILFCLLNVFGNSYSQGIQLNSGARFTINSGTTFTLIGTTSDIINSSSSYLVNQGTILLEDDFSNSGTYTSTTGIMKFNGGTQQEIRGTGSPTFFNIEVNNSSTGVLLLQPITVSNTLTLTSGNLDVNGFNINLSASGSQISGETNSRRIKGTSGEVIVTRTLSASTTYSNIAGMGISITTGATSPGNTTIKMGHTPQSGAGNTGIEKYFDISPATNSGLDATLSFYYFDNQLNGQSSNSNMGLWRSTDAGSTWTDEGGTWNDNGNNDFVQLSGINAFSKWTVSNRVSSPLPIELLNFSAFLNKNGNVDLKWKTATEINNDFFTIERSPSPSPNDNESGWASIGKVEGAGNSSNVLNYLFTDENIEIPKTERQKKMYYRLKQNDFDGNFTYSKIISIEFKSGIINNPFLPGFIVFPNPSDGKNVNITGSGLENQEGELIVEIKNLISQEIFSEIIDTENNNRFRLNIPSTKKLLPGTYIIKIKANNISFAQKLFVQ